MLSSAHPAAAHTVPSFPFLSYGFLPDSCRAWYSRNTGKSGQGYFWCLGDDHFRNKTKALGSQESFLSLEGAFQLKHRYPSSTPFGLVPQPVLVQTHLLRFALRLSLPPVCPSPGRLCRELTLSSPLPSGALKG